MVYAIFGGQTKCSMGNVKIVNQLVHSSSGTCCLHFGVTLVDVIGFEPPINRKILFHSSHEIIEILTVTSGRMESAHSFQFF